MRETRLQGAPVDGELCQGPLPKLPGILPSLTTEVVITEMDSSHRNICIDPAQLDPRRSCPGIIFPVFLVDPGLPGADPIEERAPIERGARRPPTFHQEPGEQMKVWGTGFTH